MKDRYNLPLTKREARQLYRYLLVVENQQPTYADKKGFWDRHEKLAEKLQVVIYDSDHVGKTTTNIK